MSLISPDDLKFIAQRIRDNIREEFEIKHLSGNLMNTIEVVETDGNIQVIIPAETYNMLEYFRSGAIVHTSHGSYASKLDIEGSSFFIYKGKTRKGSFRTRPGNHVGYVDRAIDKALTEFFSKHSEFITTRR